LSTHKAEASSSTRRREAGEAPKGEEKEEHREMIEKAQAESTRGKTTDRGHNRQSAERKKNGNRERKKSFIINGKSARARAAYALFCLVAASAAGGGGEVGSLPASGTERDTCRLLCPPPPPPPPLPNTALAPDACMPPTSAEPPCALCETDTGA